jgi:hypothetical protein
MIHRELNSGKWKQLSFMEQLANVGSEVSRACKWKMKNNSFHAQNSFERALELLDLTISHSPRYTATKELCRAREEMCKHFYSSNNEEFNKINRYFFPFAFAARKNF